MDRLTANKGDGGATIIRRPEFALFKYSPIVYAWLRGRRWLYVGMSRRGIVRCFYGHRVIDVVEPFLESDRLLIWSLKSPDAALKRERELIAQRRPKHNGHRGAEPRSGCAINILLSERTYRLLTDEAVRERRSRAGLVRVLINEQIDRRTA